MSSEIKQFNSKDLLFAGCELSIAIVKIFFSLPKMNFSAMFKMLLLLLLAKQNRHQVLNYFKNSKNSVSVQITMKHLQLSFYSTKEKEV